MKLVIHAVNVHKGGGRSLLVPLLMGVSEPCTALVNSRLDLPDLLPACLSIHRVRPTMVSRLIAEWHLRTLARPEDDLLCFGNLPPLFPGTKRVIVFLQNRYLLARRNSFGLPLWVRIRLAIERLWLRLFLRHAEIIVQSESMAREVGSSLGVAARVLPFAAVKDHARPVASPPVYDFIYVASNEPHKNHRTLVAAWLLLARSGIRPSLCLTLDPLESVELLRWIREVSEAGQLQIINVGVLSPSDLSIAYAQSGALIYPSLWESFGLPLIEASRAGLPILAPELDYVRDVVAPVQTFDALSPTSIARAVRRHLSVDEKPVEILSPAGFLQSVRTRC